MKNLLTTLNWVLQGIYWILVALMGYFFTLSLLDWWGTMWVMVLGAILFTGIVLVPVIFRLALGKWPAVYLTAFGCLVGCPGLILLALAQLAYPIVYRIVEGAWHTRYLILLGICLVVSVSQNLLEAYIKRKYSEID